MVFRSKEPICGGNEGIMTAELESTLERDVSEFMLELGIPAHLRGYYYLREAVVLSVSDMELVGSVTKLFVSGNRARI